MADTEMRLLALQRSIEELYDNQVRQRRMLADLLYNLDEENMPGVKALIERYKAEDGEAIAALKVSSDQNFAAIESLTAVQNDQQESIAGVKQTASSLESEIESLTSVQTEQGKNIAGVSQRADDIEADIESLASVQTEQGDNITSVTQRADDIEAEIESLVSVQTEHGKSIASIEQNATELGAEVVLAVEKASSAESAASAAESAASSAESKASSAESKASAAEDTANTAKTTADSAESTANAAKTTADTAESTANAAKTIADTAESTANAAESTANTAKSTADDAIGKVSDGAYIIARVNETSSSVKINTDKLNLSGYATSASVEQTADELGARIESLASVQTEQGENITSATQRADDIEAEIESLASVQTEHGKSIASIEQNATELGAEVVLAVEKASSAESAASAAESAASSAESKASAAESAASSAESKASAAQNTANTAKTTANAAESTANAAESTANAAESTANAAESTANAAKSTADDAIGKVSDGAYIIARVNETSSSVKINTDKLNLSGYATSASVEQTADELGARIESLASVQTEQGENITSVTQRADDIEAEIESLVSVQTEHGKSIASIEQNATELGAEVVLAVEKASSAESAASAAETAASSAESKASAAESAASSAESKASAAENTANTAKTTADSAKTTADTAKTTADSAKTTANAAESTANAAESTANAAESTANTAKSTADDAIGKVSDGAYIIARVNEDGSLVKIKADKLELSGYATFLSLKTAGATEIDGANLMTGTVSTDRIALNENGQINFDKLGTLSFSEPSGASGEMRISENEYGRGEIGINADGTVALGAGSASFILLDTGNGSTEASVDASSFRMNGKRGISGTYYFGNGSITVENGIVTAMTSDSGEYEPVELLAPEVDLDGEYCYYSISNPNGIGTIFFRTYWYDNYGGEWESELEYSDDLSVSGYISEFPSNGGYIGVRAWVEYGESVSDTASSESSYA